MMLFSIFGIGFDVPWMFIAAFPILIAFLVVNRRLIKKRTKLPILILRSLAIFSLMMVLSMPYLTREEEIERETTSIFVLEDESDSMSIYGGRVGSMLADRLDGVINDLSDVDYVNMSEGNKTALGDAIYQNIIGASTSGSVAVVVSDGNNNDGVNPIDVATFAAESKSRIYVMAPNVESDEVYISGIGGADKVPANSKYTGTVVIGSVGQSAEYQLKITIDGASILDTPVVQTSATKEIKFEHTFSTQGAHKITASIVPKTGDKFAQNNIFNKVVNVIEQPRILLLSGKTASPLKQVLEEVYDVDVSGVMPSDISYYSAVVIDDEPVATIGTRDIRDFLNDGGGVVVVGGNHSYEKGGYYESDFENYLPVRSREGPEKKGDEVNVVLLIDVSGSTGALVSGETKIDVEKAIAIGILRDIWEKNKIGVVAFNSEAYLLEPIRKFITISGIEGDISRLRFGGGTYIITGLVKADEMLSLAQGSKYVILISDGITNYPVQAFDEVGRMVDKGITVHTVGVGFDTDESFMSGLARRGNGIYFAPSDTGRIKIVMGSLEENEEEGGFSMIIVDKHHFITEGLEMSNLSIKNFNQVSAKSSAQVLAATQGMKPLLTVWRFGLGRVASLSVDDGYDWANQLYTKDNSRLISSTVNWAIGDPERKRGLRIECVDTNVGEETPIIVTSDKDYPDISLGDDKISLSRIDDENYYFNYYPKEVGFATISAQGYSCSMAVNYAEEYGKFGVDLGVLTAMAGATGGEVYRPSEADALISAVSDYTVSESTGVSIEKNSIQAWFALLGVLLFFADVVIRRIREIRLSRRGG